MALLLAGTQHTRLALDLCLAGLLMTVQSKHAGATGHSRAVDRHGSASPHVTVGRPSKATWLRDLMLQSALAG